MLEALDVEPVDLVERVCAIDIGKSGLVACVRVPHDTLPERRRQEVREFATTSGALLGLADWLRCQQVELVAMEATSDYWDSQKLHQMGSWSDGSAGVGGLSHVLFTQESRLLGCGFVRLIPFDA